MSRDVANRFNHQMGDTLVPPLAKIQESTMYVPGTDGEKMSKSKDNIIDIFLTDKQLRKQIMKIKTDSTPLEEPKNPDTCNLFNLYKLVASEEEIAQMRSNYLGGNYGYGHAKQAFYDLLTEKFKSEREKYHYYMSNLKEIDEILLQGAKKAHLVADAVLKRVRQKLGY
jgi:tryptophanyl-tRNA synthetase